MNCVGYNNECTCPPCLKKYSRWQKAILKIEIQECFEELKKARKSVGLSGSTEEINKIISDYNRMEKQDGHYWHLLPKIHPECEKCIKNII